jgi:hypothetical protein
MHSDTPAKQVPKVSANLKAQAALEETASKNAKLMSMEIV